MFFQLYRWTESEQLSNEAIGLSSFPSCIKNSRKRFKQFLASRVETGGGKLSSAALSIFSSVRKSIVLARARPNKPKIVPNMGSKIALLRYV